MKFCKTLYTLVGVDVVHMSFVLITIFLNGIWSLSPFWLKDQNSATTFFWLPLVAVTHVQIMQLGGRLQSSPQYSVQLQRSGG